MKAITLRNVPRGVLKAIRAKARKKRISVNRAVIELLQERIGILEEQKKTVYDDLDGLAGVWSKGEAKSFEKALGAARRVEPDLWK